MSSRRARPGPPLNTLLLGSCMLLWPLLRTRAAEGRMVFNAVGRVKEIHTFGEMFQFIDVIQQRKIIPRDLIGLTHVPRRQRDSAIEDFGTFDLAVLGPSSPVEITFRGLALNRLAIQRHIGACLNDKSGEAEKHLGIWLRQGVVGLNARARAESGERLLEFLRDNTAEAELARSVIREAEVSKSDIAGGFRKMRELLNCPIIVALYIFRYMPDGRAISWPAGYREEVLAAAHQLDLPVFDPSPLVVQHGPSKVLASGFSHYRPDFLPLVGEALVAFAQAMCTGAHARP